MPTRSTTAYQFLMPRTGSRSRQLFVEGRIRAETIYRQTIGSDAQSPDAVAADYEIPVEAVHEAIDYCICHQRLLDQERTDDLRWMRKRGLDRPPFVPSRRKRKP